MKNWGENHLYQLWPWIAIPTEFHLRNKQTASGVPPAAQLSKRKLFWKRGGEPHPVRVGGTPWQGYHHLGLGYPHQGLEYPRAWDWGISPPGIRVPPAWDWGTPPFGMWVIPCPGLGYPLTWDWGTPCLGLGYPPGRELGSVTGVASHQKGHEIRGSIMGWRWGSPPPVRCEQTGKLKTLPSPSFGFGP